MHPMARRSRRRPEPARRELPDVRQRLVEVRVRVVRLLLLLCALGAGAAACGTVSNAGSPGGPAASGPSASGPPAATPTPSSGQVLGTATNAAGWTAVVTAEPDAQLQLTVTVVGPLTVTGGCFASLTAWAETPAGSLVPTPTPVPAAHCLAIVLVVVPAGTTRAFSASLPEPAAPGTYVIQGTLATEGVPGSPAAALPAVPPVTISI